MAAASIPKVYAAINAVQAELAKTGIAKDQRNQQQGYAFRGIDDIYAALAPLLSEHKLLILPKAVDRWLVEKTTKTGTVLYFTAVKVEYELVSAEDGSKHVCCMFGEAMDSGDKSCNKAMSAAFKYLCLQAFAIPIEGEDNDADRTTHEEQLTPLELFRRKVTGLRSAEEFNAAMADYRNLPESIRKAQGWPILSAAAEKQKITWSKDLSAFVKAG